MTNEEQVIAELQQRLSTATERWNRRLRAHYMLGYIRMSEYAALGKPVPCGGIQYWVQKPSAFSGG